jgi:malate synthase
MRSPNQIDRRPDCEVKAADLLTVPQGEITQQGLDRNIEVGLQYLASWLGGNGCVPIYNLMEDTATAEICRAQVWQWVKHGAHMSDGRTVTPALVEDSIQRQAGKLRELMPGPALELACRTYEEMILSADFADFLTLRAYGFLD